MPTFYVTYDFALNLMRSQLPPGKEWVEYGDMDLEIETKTPEQALHAFYATWDEPWKVDFLKGSHTVGVLTKGMAWRVEGDQLVPVPLDHRDAVEWQALWDDLP